MTTENPTGLLRPYVQHLAWCDDKGDDGCTCGLRAALAATEPGLDEERPVKPVPKGLSRLTLDDLRDKAEAAGITWWGTEWTRRDFIDAIAARLRDTGSGT